MVDLLPLPNMEITETYAIFLGSLFLSILLINVLRKAMKLIKNTWLLLSKFLFYSNFIRRHRLIGPWRYSIVISHLTLLAINILCLIFRVASVSEAGVRAGRLSLVNMILLFSGPSFSFLADLWGVSLCTYKSLHRSAGIVSLALALVHAFIFIAARDSPTLSSVENLYAVIVGTL